MSQKDLLEEFGNLEAVKLRGPYILLPRMKLLPRVITSGPDTNTQYFADPAIIPPVVLKHNQSHVLSAPLAFGKTFDLIGLSHVPESETDVGIDKDMQLENIYIRFTDVNGISSVVVINTLRRPDAVWMSKGHRQRELSLNFSMQQSLTRDTTEYPSATALNAHWAAMEKTRIWVDMEWPKAKAFEYLRSNNVQPDFSCMLDIRVTGLCNIETGEVSVQADKPTINVNSAVNKATAILFSETIAKIDVVGYDLMANKSRFQR